MRKLLRENIHVDVEPCSHGYFEEGIIKTCEGIKEQVLRHIDDVAQVSVVWEGRSVCSFCGRDWEVNENPGDPDYDLDEPTCCAAAQEEWSKLKEEKGD